MNITFEQIQEMIHKAEENNACNYQLNIIKSLKNISDILNNNKIQYWAYWYAKNIIKDRWPEAEEIIKNDPKWSYYYARDVIKGRWLDAEEYIKKDPEWAYRYAKDIIKGRWLEAEYIIKTSQHWLSYLKKFYYI